MTAVKRVLRSDAPSRHEGEGAFDAREGTVVAENHVLKLREQLWEDKIPLLHIVHQFVVFELGFCVANCRHLE